MKEHGFGSTKKGFNKLTSEYKKSPSIENYVKLRRQHPRSEIEVSVLGGIDPLFYMEPVLKQYGFDPQLIASVMDADADSISEASLQLMEKMIEARQRSMRGDTHLIRRGHAIPDKLIDWIVCCSLDALSWNDDLYIPRDLIVLIRERLGGSNPEYRQGSQTYEKKRNAGLIAGQLKARGVRPTYKLLASILKVAPSTVKRWFKPGEFEQEADRWSQLCDRNGNLLPLSGLKGGTLRKKQSAQR